MRYTLSIQSNGEINPCVRFFYSLGNVNNDSIMEVWNDSQDLLTFQNIKWGDLTKCADCRLSLYCKRCPGVAFMEKADIYSKSRMYCNLAECKAEAYEK